MSLGPTKAGFMGIVNDEVMGWLVLALQEVQDTLVDNGGDSQLDADPMVILKAIRDLDEWSSVNDNFGRKAYKALPVGDGEYRVTVLLTKSSEYRDMKIDVRKWSEYERY